MHRTALLILALLTLPGTAAHAAASYDTALGRPGDPAKVDRSIEISVNDEMRFSPDEVQVKRGQTIRFMLVNSGSLRHMMVLGRQANLKKQAAQLAKTPEMKLANPAAVSIEPGETGQLVWRFTRAGRVDFACLVPGHLIAGMRGKVIVRP